MMSEAANKELVESVAYFEQILNVLPEDRTALEFLCVAGLQVGDKQLFLRHAVTLADVLVREKDVEAAQGLAEKLAVFDDPKAKTAVLKLKVLAAPTPDLKGERVEAPVTCADLARAVQAEKQLVARLVSDGALGENIARTIDEQLDQPIPSGENVLVSALSILEKENAAEFPRVAAAVADAAHAPPIPLESFEIVPGNVRLLPEDLVRVRGVLPFAKLGKEWAVAVLNPLDDALRREVAEALGAPCHFFLASPHAVESVLERIFRAVETEGDGSDVPPVVNLLVKGV